MKYLLSLFVAVFMFGCNHSRVDIPVLVFLDPIQAVETDLGQFEYDQVPLLDNDGNLYLTYWDIGRESVETFSEDITVCESAVVPQSLFRGALSISQIDVGQIKPSRYVPMLKCLYARGYQLKDKKAVLPLAYKVRLVRGHSSSNTYMPVGSTFHIVKDGENYLGAYTAVNVCKVRASRGNNGGIDEVIGSDFITVSIVTYVDIMKACLAEMSFKLVQ